MTDASGQTSEHERAPRKSWVGLGIAGLVLAFVIVVVVSRLGRKPGGLGPLGVAPGALAGWNVLLVSIDTLRADRVGCYGHAEAATRALDALAAGGVRFRYAIAPVPVTLPSHASLLTGLNPHRHGARANGVFRVEGDQVTLAELLKGRGYQTGAIISAHVLDRRYGLDQGFDDYDDDLRSGEQPMRFGFRERRAQPATDAAVRWLRDRKDDPFFLFVHYFDPHVPYSPPEPYLGRFAGRLYDGEVAYTDEHLGRLVAALDAQGLGSRTLVVVVSDHGESLGEHKERTHGIMIYDATVRVPMIFRAEGVLPTGKVITGQVGLIDVVPTVLDLLGIAVPSGLDGVSLVRSAASEPRDLYIETLLPKMQYGWAPLMGIRRDDVKFILAPKPELYDLRNDPNELNNLLAARRDVADELHRRLRDVVGQDPSLVASVSGNLPLDVDSREKLEALGYVFGVGESSATQQAPPDPKDMMDNWRVLQRAEALADAGEHAKAIPVYESVLRKEPRNWRAWQLLGESYQALGKLDQALPVLRKGQAGYPKLEVAVRIGEVLLAQGKVPEAEAAFNRILADHPQFWGGLFGLASVRVEQNRKDEALKLYQKCIEVGRSTTGSAYFNIGALHYAAGRIEEARQAFERSMAADPRSPRAARALAELMRREGRVKEAIDLLQRTIALQADAKALMALGGLCAQAGQSPRAEAALRRCIELDPTLPRAHYRLAKILQRSDRSDEALAEMAAFVRLLPSHPRGQLELGVMLAKRKRWVDAEKHLREAVRLSPKDSSAHYNLGVLLAGQDRFAEAGASLRQAVHLDPNHAPAQNALGQVLKTLGRTDEAAACFRRALKIDPKLKSAREGLRQCASRPASSPTRPASSR